MGETRSNVTEPKLDLTKPVQTRDGRRVRIYVTNWEGPYSVHGAILDPPHKGIATWNKEGGYVTGILDPSDLVNIPPRKVKVRREVFVHVYDGERVAIYSRPIGCATLPAILEYEIEEPAEE